MNDPLIVIGSIGYANLAVEVYGLLGSQSGGLPSWMFAASSVVSVMGVIAYWKLRHRAGSDADRRHLRLAASPYIMGATIALLAVTLVLGLGAVASLRDRS